MMAGNSIIYAEFIWQNTVIPVCGITHVLTRRSVEHYTPHADGAWLNELGRSL